MMKISTLSSALAIVGVLSFSGQALADTVTAKFTGMTQTDGIHYSVVLPPDGGSTIKSGNTSVGIFNFDNGSGPIDFFDTDQFVSFCIDLEDTIGGGNTVTWDVTALADSPDAIAGPMGATKANDVAKVLGYMIDSGRLNDARFLAAAEKQAIQAVIWEIVHEDPNNSYSLANGTATFTGLTTNAQTEVTDILTNFGDATAMQGLVGLSSSGKQDFIGQVPIPAAAWLFGSAIMGTVALGRRKQKKANT